ILNKPGSLLCGIVFTEHTERFLLLVINQEIHDLFAKNIDPVDVVGCHIEAVAHVFLLDLMSLHQFLVDQLKIVISLLDLSLCNVQSCELLVYYYREYQHQDSDERDTRGVDHPSKSSLLHGIQLICRNQRKN